MSNLTRRSLRWRRRGRELARLGAEEDLRLEVRSDDEDGDLSSDDEDDIPSPKVTAAEDSDSEDSPSPTATVFPPNVLSSSTSVLGTTTSTLASTSTTASLPPPPPPPPPPPAPPATTQSVDEPPPVLAPAVSDTSTSTTSTLLTTTSLSPLSSSSVVQSAPSSRPVVTVTPPAQTTTIVSTTSLPQDPPFVFSSESRTTLTTILPQTPKDEPTSTLPSSTSLASETAGAPRESQTSIDGQPVYKEKQSDGPPGSMKVGIAFGTVAAVALIVGVLWCAWLIRRRRRRRNRGERLADEVSYPDGGQREQGTASSWPSIGGMTAAAPAVKRSNESILNEVRQAAFGSFNSHGGAPGATQQQQQTAVAELPATPFGPQIPRGFDEKLHDPACPLPVLSPSQVDQPSIRRSIASWLRRTSRHHPLRLNPMGGGGAVSSRTSVASSVASRGGGHHAMRTPSPGDGDVPPVPALPLPPLLSGQQAGLAEPAPAFSRDEAAAYYRRLQNGSKPTVMPSVTDVSSESASVRDVSPVDSRGSEGTGRQGQSIYSLYASSEMDEKGPGR